MEIEGIIGADIWDNEDWACFPSSLDDKTTHLGISKAHWKNSTERSLLKRHISPLQPPPHFWNALDIGVLKLPSCGSREVFCMRPLTLLERLELVCCSKKKKKKNLFERCAHAVKKVGKEIAKGAEKVAHEVKEFVQEHAKEIIVVAAVVAGVAVVAGIVVAASAAAAEATAEAAAVVVAAAAVSKKKEEEESTTSVLPESTSNTPPPSSSTDSLLTTPDFATFNYPSIFSGPSPLPTTPSPLISDHQQLQEFNFNQTSLEPPSISSWNPATATFSNPDLNATPSIILNNTPSFSEPKRTFPSITFVDPDGPPRVYNTHQPELPRSTTFEITGLQLARGGIGGINGIGNSIEDAQAHAQYLKKLSLQSIQWVHNCSHSIPVDVIETLFFNYHGVSAPAKLLKENWIQFDEQHKSDPGAKYLQFCHSQGAIHVKNALLDVAQEIRDRVIVVAIAPAAIVPDDICFKSFNYASKRDPVPYTEAALYVGSDDSLVRELGQQKLEELKQLILLDPHPDAPLIDHEFESPTFKDPIERHLGIHIKEYGKSQ